LDKKLETEGNADKAKGELQNAVGGLKDLGARQMAPSPSNTINGDFTMELILIIVVLVLLFGGGGYWGRRRGHW
jgi:hypothetical protein